MQIKTFTALITVAVGSDEDMPNEFVIGDLIREAVNPEDVSSKHSSIIMCHASVVPNDMMVEPTSLVKKSEGRTLTELFDLGRRINNVKAQHALLRGRAVDGGGMIHPSSAYKASNIAAGQRQD